MKVRPAPSSPNPEWVLCNIPVLVPVVTSTCEVMPRLAGKSSAGSVTLETEWEIRHDVGGTVAIDLDENDVNMTTSDVDRAENTPQSKVMDTGGNGDDEEPEVEFQYEKIGTFSFPPTITEAEATFADIKKVLKPPCKKGPGYDHHGFDELTHSHVEAMRKFLWKYISGNSTAWWGPALLETAHDYERGTHHACLLQEWTHAYVATREDLPKNTYGTWKPSMLNDEDLATTIHLHLQSLGPWIQAQDVVDFINKPETKAQFWLIKSISLSMATWWMKCLGYRWTLSLGGQYIDGYKRKDIVDYQQKGFLPRWMSIEEKTWKWKEDWTDEEVGEQPQNRCVVIWFHDKSTFYANNH